MLHRQRPQAHPQRGVLACPMPRRSTNQAITRRAMTRDARSIAVADKKPALARYQGHQPIDECRHARQPPRILVDHQPE